MTQHCLLLCRHCHTQQTSPPYTPHSVTSLTPSISQQIFNISNSKATLDVDDSAQLLHSVQQNISLFDAILVLPVFTVRTVCFNDAPDFVNLTVQTTCSNEARQLLVNELYSYSKSLCHVVESQTPVGLQ